MVQWSLPRRGFPLNCAQYNRGRRCGFGRETGEICKNSDPCGEKRKKLKKCKEKTAEKVQNFAGEVQAREKASWRRWEVQFQGATGLPRAASAAPNPGMPYLRRKREAKWPDSEKLLGNFWPLSRNDFLKLRRQPGKKQVGAAGKFNSEVPQACLGAAAAAPNPGISILRRKREAKWPDSEKLLVFIKE